MRSVTPFGRPTDRAPRERLLVNLGCGTRWAEGFENWDNSPSVLLARLPWVKSALFRMGLIARHQLEADWSGVKWRDLNWGLPYASGSVDKIYSSHFLEHVSPGQGRRILAECFRVLKPRGVIRLVVPDLLFHAERYVERTRRASRLDSADDGAHREFLNAVAGHYLKGGRPGREHKYMYDWPSLVKALSVAGFAGIRKRSYREGDGDLAPLDCRPHESLHVEAKKPAKSA